MIRFAVSLHIDQRAGILFDIVFRPRAHIVEKNRLLPAAVSGQNFPHAQAVGVDVVIFVAPLAEVCVVWHVLLAKPHIRLEITPIDNAAGIVTFDDCHAGTSTLGVRHMLDAPGGHGIARAFRQEPVIAGFTALVRHPFIVF